MKTSHPKRGELPLKPVMRMNNKRYEVPYDVDWLTVTVSEERHGPVMMVLGFMAAIVLSFFTYGIAFLIFLIAWQLSTKEVGTIEIMFKDGLFIRGHSKNQKEIKFAQRNVMNPLPDNAEVIKRNPAPILKMVRNEHN